MKEGEIHGERAEPRYTIEAYYKGFKILLTQPFENGGAIVGLLDKMVDAGFSGERVIYKAPEGPTQSQPDKEKPKEPEGHLCAVHGVEMRKFEKDGRSWYAHNVNGQWCNGKAKK